MGDPLSGAALGAAVGVLFTEVFTALKKAVNDGRMFKSRLLLIESALNVTKHQVEEIMQLNKQLHKFDDELKTIHDILEECRSIVENCSKVQGWWDPTVISLSRKLNAVDDRLVRYAKFDLQFIIARDLKTTLVKVEQNNTQSVVQPEENRPNSTEGTTSSFVVTADLALGALVGALIAELLSLKQAIEATHLGVGTSGSMLEPLQLEEINSQVEELRPIHGLVKAGLGLINKCRMFRREYRFWDYSTKLQVNLDNGIHRLCQVDLVGILIGNVQIINNTMHVPQLMDDIACPSVLLEKDITNRFESCDVPPCPDFVVGCDFTFQNIKEELLTGEEPVIVISGTGGYGKTTLVTKLCHDEHVTGKYKDIIFVVASESVSLVAVIQRIIIHLGREIPDLTTQTEDDAVQLLKQLVAERAKQNPVLLVLDDFGYGGESIHEKFEYIQNYRVLVTSRSKLPSIRCSHQLEGLKDEDAVKLLSHAATPRSDCNYKLPDDTTIHKVAEGCKGSPFALTVVGRSLCGKPKSAWIAKLKELSDGVSLFGSLDGIRSKAMRFLMDSLNRLEGTQELERLKKCYLDLGSFPEDHQICVATLVDMWSILHGTDANGLDTINALIQLSARSLVNLVSIKACMRNPGDGYYNNMHVQVHDLLRELIILLNSEGPIEEREKLDLTIRKKNLPEWLLKEQKQPFKARVVSISTDEDISLALLDLELPAAEVLILNFRTTENSYTLPNFIKTMEDLKILVVINSGPLPVKLNNFHLIASLLNLKKIRLEKIKIESSHAMNNDFCMENLEKISAFLCDISEEIQISDLGFPKMFPKLEEIDISYCTGLKTLPDGICNASNTLKKISITDCHDLSKLPRKIGNLLELQVLRLNSCTSLEGLPSSIVDLKNLSFLDISSCLSIRQLPDLIGKLHQLKELHLSDCQKLFSLPSSVRKLRQLENLIIDEGQVIFVGRAFGDSPWLKQILSLDKRDVSLNFMGSR